MSIEENFSGPLISRGANFQLSKVLIYPLNVSIGRHRTPEKKIDKVSTMVFGRARFWSVFKNFEKLFYLVLKCYMSVLMVITKLSSN